MLVKGKPLKLTYAGSVISVNSDRKATIANITVMLNGTYYVATGSSWRDSGDPYDKTKGDLIAFSRAVEELRDVLKEEVRKLGD